MVGGDYMKRAFRKNIFRTIRKSFGRYVAILAIIALGVGFFTGLKASKPAMMKTGQDYTFLRDFIFTHPSMSEALNDLFA